MAKDELIVFLKGLISREADWFHESMSICSCFTYYKLNILQDPSLEDLVEELNRHGVDWARWSRYSGIPYYPIPITDERYTDYSALTYHLYLTRYSYFWVGEQGALRTDLCHWLLAELEK